MVQTCTKCSRANPEEAIYCHFDGFVLPGHGQNGGPVAVGAQAFPTSFVFPSGRSCRSFNELAIACQEEWDTARDLLNQGYLEKFLGGLGRLDLAQTAREAAEFPDRDRGLDQLLAKFPGDVLDEPKLKVEPTEFNLGVLKVGQNRELELRLENQGMRLLYGSINTEDGVWLALGETTGGARKLFQFTDSMVLPIHIRGDRLRANNKPLETRLVIESNGGMASVLLRAEVPVKAFPLGALQGAKSPRQAAEKARANPKGAAPLFENGDVARWYKENGWTYPVQGPASSGLAAVQQFFEALGLTPPPKVAIDRRSIALQGEPGEQLTGSVEVRTQEKRPVYAHATSNQPWLEVSRAKLNGRVATINFSIPSVPNRPGEELKARLLVQSNGNQRFNVPVTLQIAGERVDYVPADEVMPVEEEPVPTSPFRMDEPPAPVSAAPPLSSAFAPDPGPSAGPLVSPPIRRSRSRETQQPIWVHLIPAALLLFALFCVFLSDLIVPGTGGGGGGEPQFNGEGDWNFGDLAHADPQIGVTFNRNNHRFGLVMLKEKDPDDPTKYKKLTRDVNGNSNNTCITIDGSPFLFGQPPGYWPKGKHLNSAPKGSKRNYHTSVMEFPQTGLVRVKQHVEIVPGEQSRLLDTCLVWYTVKNIDTSAHKVGLRIMLDTFIGANDGVPFVIPGKKGLLRGKREFDQKEIPDYIEALEKPDPKKPGTVAHLGLKGISLPGIKVEKVHKLLICRWTNSETRWKPDPSDIRPISGNRKEKGDSCVFVYWAEQPMRPGEVRHMAFTYGLGKIATGAGKGQLGLTAGGSFQPGSVFTVTAYVRKPSDGQKVKLILPAGLSLAGGELAEKKVDAGADYGQVSWRVRGDELGEYTIKAESGSSHASYKVKIKRSGIFGSG